MPANSTGQSTHKERIMREIEQQVKELAAYVKALEALQALKRMLK